MSTYGSGAESIVIPAISAPSSVSFVRSLGRHGVRPITVSERKTASGFSSRYSAESHVVPGPDENLRGYEDALLSLAERSDVRALVPMREADVFVLARRREQFADHVSTLWPSFEQLRTVHDRRRLVEVAGDAGVAAPETQLLSEVDDWDRNRIVKGRYSVLTHEYEPSVPPRKLLDPGSTRYLEAGTEPDVASIRGEMRHNPIAQEFVGGDEYALWALYDEGEPVATCQKHQLRGWNYAGGTSVYRRTVCIPELEQAGRALLDELDWHGFASVQFKREPDSGEFTLMEINPRVWVSLPCAVRAGANFPLYFWQTATGKPVDIDPENPYEEDVATHLLRGEAAHLTSVLSKKESFVDPPTLTATAVGMAKSMYRPKHRGIDYLSADDPLPFVRGALNVSLGQMKKAL
ncbi:ATP-grasp domain-containing protein [Haloprofundus salinisoli]|uniref:carboxylate--amine ligase n=1 Tax=Haloprofundus salinisoli TaxID=2876193 RepID=UPI001CCD163C|nr:ATP-grasp domain-containing protein [Haloprofundus salinisoli]